MLGSQAPSAAPGVRGWRTEASSPSTPEGRPGHVQWGKALAYGLGAAVVGGLIWGLIEYVTGYVFGLVAIVIGLFVAWAIHKGAGSVSVGVIALGSVFTLLAIFLGQFIALSLVASEFGVSPMVVLARYPEIIAAVPALLLDYLFAVFGVFVAARHLWRQRRAAFPESTIPPSGGYHTPPAASPSPFSGSAFAATTPQARLLERGVSRVAVEVQVPGDRPRTVRATYSTMTGMAEVFVDGSAVKSARVWGLSKELPVPLDGAGGTRTLSLRFYGVGAPHIDVHLDGSALGTF